ncbi:MAG: LPS export ABC transporter ATP-binding protein [Bacteroidota bacterium]
MGWAMVSTYNMKQLRAEKLVKRYKKNIVVKDTSLSVSQGEVVGLLGPNGAGKTTTFYMLVGLVQPDTGHVYLDETRITDLPMYQRARLGISYLPQEACVFRNLTVEENLMAILELTKLSPQARKEKMETLLEEFGITHIRKRQGKVLSGGERRRTEIARALVIEPKFVLLDEPFAGVDPIAVEEIQSLIDKLKYKQIGVLITDHNVNETLSITDRAYLMFEGSLLKAGTAQELAVDEQVRRLYLGKHFELRRKV